MKKAIIAIAAMFLISCGGSSETTVSDSTIVADTTIVADSVNVDSVGVGGQSSHETPIK